MAEEKNDMVKQDSIKESKKDERKIQVAAKTQAKQEAKKIKVVVGEDEYFIKKESVFEYARRDFKIQENNKKIMNGEVAVLLLREGGVGDLKYVRPDNGMFIVQGHYYHIIDSCIFNIGKKRIPLAVIPEWSFIPLSKKDFGARMGEQEQSAQKLIIKSLENAEIVKINSEFAPKDKPNGKLIVWILIAGVVGIYVLSKMFGG